MIILNELLMKQSLLSLKINLPNPFPLKKFTKKEKSDSKIRFSFLNFNLFCEVYATELFDLWTCSKKSSKQIS